MARWNNFYLIRIEFLGFRYHGWQVQPGLKSIEGMMNKTFLFIFKHENFKILGCGRTDAKVSANDFALELFLNEKINSENLFLALNKNLPADIRAKSIQKINADFNIIQHSKIKEYHYYFSFGEKPHPFNAPFSQNFGEYLNTDLMMMAAKLFEGTHNFKRYASNITAKTNCEREITSSKIVKNHQLITNFTPTNTYIFKVSSKGFLRYQVRLMMAALISVGQGLMSLSDFKDTLINFDGEQIKNITPSSGLVLHRVTF